MKYFYCPEHLEAEELYEIEVEYSDSGAIAAAAGDHWYNYHVGGSGNWPFTFMVYDEQKKPCFKVEVYMEEKPSFKMGRVTDICKLCEGKRWLQGEMYDDGSYVTMRPCNRCRPDYYA